MFRIFNEFDDMIGEHYILQSYMFFSFFVGMVISYLSYSSSYLLFFMYCYIISDQNFIFALKTCLIYMFLKYIFS